MKNMKYKILFVLSLIAFIASFILSIPNGAVGDYCPIGEENCNAVKNSSYNYTFNIQNSNFGILIFFGLSLLIYLHIIKPSNKKRRIIKISLILGSLVSLYFLYLQQFILKAYCAYCLVVDISILISLGIIFFWKE